MGKSDKQQDTQGIDTPRAIGNSNAISGRSSKTIRDALKRNYRRRLVLEPLEDRRVLTAMFYWANGEKVDVYERTDQYAIKVTDSQPEQLLSRLTADNGLLEGFEVKESFAPNIWRLENTSTVGPTRLIDTSTFAIPGVDWLTSSYVNLSNHERMLVVDELVVGLREGVNAEKYFDSMSLVIGNFDYRPLLGTPDQFVLTLNGRAGDATLDASHRLSQDERVSFAAPNMYHNVQRYFIPNDTLFPTQWHLNNTGTQVTEAIAGADVNAVNAWNLSTGTGVTIAVLDDGIERSHPDLAENIFVNPGEIAGNSIDDDGNGYIDDVSGWSFATNSPNPSVTTSDQHGTSVAGVAAGRGNNSLGVAGSAFNAKILPVQIFNGGAFVGEAGAASAMYYAAGRTANGLGTWNAAQVINNSWGGGGVSTVLTNAFTWASDTARGGKGVPTFISSGNGYANAVSFPASLASTLSGVMAVGSSNHRDLRSEYSNYGTALDFLASSNDINTPYTVGITTTDRTGGLGYNTGDYTNNTVANGFGGTSSASPLAAGVGALLLSLNPNLTAAQVRTALRSTADKVGGVVYDANGFNLEYGYGRIDAFAALQSLGLQVVSSVPAVGTAVATPPVSFVIQFSHAVNPATINASDLQVNGVSASSVVLSNADQTATFGYTVSPVTVEGAQSMNIAAGAITRASDGNGIGTFNGVFRYDTLSLAVSTTVPAVGGTLNLPGVYDVNFNEPINPASIHTDDLTLSVGTVVSAVALDADSVRYTINGVTVDTPITITFGAGKVTDTFGNPNPAEFVANYFSDISTVAFPLPLASKDPLGSLVYDSSVTGVISTVDDTDNYTISLDPGQKITVYLDPATTLKGLIRIYDSSNNLLGSATNSVGLDAVIQTVSTVAITDTYRIEVSSDGAATTGTYTLGLILNARAEAESYNGPTNDNFATAEDINGNFIALNASASRGAVLGLATGNDFFQFNASAGDTVSVALQSLSSGTVNAALFDPAGFQITTAISGPVNVGRILNNFVVPTTGSYRVRVTGVTAATPYNLVVLKNADFDSEANDSFAAAQFIGGADGALGYAEKGAIRVAVQLSTVDATYTTAVVNQLNDDSYFNFTATAVTDSQIDSAAELASYDVVVLGDYAALISPATAAALKAWVQSGLGGIVASSWTNFNLKYNSTDAATQADLDVILPINMALEFTDEYAGSTIITDGAHPVTTGVISFGSSGESLAGGADAGATVLAVDELGRPAIVVGASGSGRGVYLRPAYVFGQPDTQTPDADRLLEQAIAWSALAATTRDASDWYSVSVNAGDSLTIQTRTPADGAGNFTNDLNPELDLYGPSGSLVSSGVLLSDGRNEQIVHTASTTGLYRVRVGGEGGTVGEYFVSVNGNTGTERPAFQVTSTSPLNGARILAQPSVYTVNLSDAQIAGTLQASDLKVNGINATGVTFVDGDTALFTIPSGLGSGTHTVTIEAGSILDVQNTPIQAYTGTFTVDTVAPRVVATSVAANSIIAPGALSYTVTFSEPMNVANILSTGDFTLRGNIRQAVTGNYVPSSFSFNAARTELTLNYANLPDDDYTLTLVAGTTSGTNFTDVAGNALDGEFSGTLPSGNGVGGGNFVTGFIMDRATEALTLLAENPLGSLNYERTLVRTIAFAGDVDEFTLNVDPNQTISVVVTPTTPLLVPRVELFSPSNVLLESSSASAPGQTIGIQTRPTSVGGTYRVVVNGLTGTIGRYTIDVVLNAAFETEDRIVGLNTNDTPGTAQNINGSFISLDPASPQVQRGAVAGTTDIAAILLPNEIEPNNTQATSNIAAANFAAYSNELYHLGFRGDSSSTTDIDFFNIGTLQVGDVLSVSVSGSPSFRGTNTDTFVRLYRGTSAAPILVSSNDDGGVGLDALLSGVTILATDTYYVQMDAAANARSGTYEFGLYLENFDTAPITGGSFTQESESNNTAATANNASTSWRSVQYRSQTSGEIVTSDLDFYRYQFTAGDLVTINVDSQSTLDARVNLRNAAGTIIARDDGTSVGPGTDSPVYSFIIPSSGAYYVDVLAAAGTTGIYSLDVLLSTNSPISFPPIGVDYYSFTASAGQPVTLAVSGLTTGNVDVQLIGTNGTSVLASGVAGATNLNEVISNFPISATGTYFARVTGDLGITYSLVVTQGAAFDTENNNTSLTAQSLNGTQGVLGHVRASSSGASEFDFENGNQGFTVNNGASGLWHRTTHRGSETGHSSLTSFHYGREGGTYDSGQRNTGSIVSPAISLPSSGPITFGFNYILQTEANTSFDTANVQISTNDFSTFTTIASRTTNLPNSVTWREFTSDLSAFAGQSVRIRWIFDSLDNGDNNYAGWFVDDVRVGIVGDDDWYSVSVPNAGDPIRFETSTPSDGTGEFVNALNPRIELYRPDGTLLTSGTVLADGRNERILISAPVAGTYRVRVSAEGTANGEYFLASNFAIPATTIESIIASGSHWSAAFIDSVDGGGIGAGNGMGYDLVQGTTVPNAGVDRIYVQFNQPVLGFDASNVAVLGVNVADYGGRMTVTYDSLNMRGVIAFSESISNDNLRVGLSGSITDAALNAFDGDIDASTGSILDFRFNVSVGDASNDGAVNGGDLPSFAAAFNSSVGSPRYNERADWNADGTVNGGDLPLYALGFNRTPRSEPSTLNFLPSAADSSTEESEQSDLGLAPIMEAVDSYFSEWSDEDEAMLS